MTRYNLLLVILFLSLISSDSFAQVIVEQLLFNNSMGSSSNGTGQSFTAPATGALSSVQFAPTGSDNATLRIYEGNGTGGNLLYQESVSYTNTSPNFFVFNLQSPVLVTQNTQYTIMLFTSGLSVSRYLLQDTDVYNGGVAFYNGSAHDGGSMDLKFRVSIVTNNPPTASSNSLPVDEDNILTISTSDFGYSDGDTDPLDHVEISSVPGNGTLFKDDNTNGAFDTGEELSDNDQLTKAELDASKLKFKPRFNENGTPYTTFDFRVNDGTDYSSSTYTITINVNAVNDAPIAGSGKALDFDGTDDFVNAGDISMGNSFTIEGWFYLKTGGANQHLFGKGFHGFVWYDQGGGLRMEFRDPGDTKWYGTPQDGGALVPVNTSTWYHVAVTFGGSGSTMKLYLNGQLAAETNVINENPFDSPGDEFKIGQWDPNNPDRQLNGKIDDVRVWGDVRTQAEIENNMFIPLNGSESGLLAYYRFDEGTGNMLHDATSSKYDGTLTNMDPGSDWEESDAWKNRTTNEDTDLVINPEGYDPDGTALGTSSQVGAPSNGSLSFASVTYSPNSNYNGSDSFTYQVTDGTLTDNFQVSVDVSAINDDPEITGLPTDINVTEETASNVNLTAATFSDADAGANNITLTIAAGSGTLSASSSGGVAVGGSGTGTLTLTGTASDIDTYLNTASNIQYTGAADVFGDNVTTLTLTANDGGNTGSGGGNDVALGTVNVDIDGVNDDPVFTGLPTDLSFTEDTFGNFDLASGTFSDVDAGGNDVTLTATANIGGTFQLANPGGLLNATGNATSSFSLEGTAANIETYLSTASNVQYKPPLNVNGQDAGMITVKANDGGNTGTGGGNDVTLGTINIDITAVNDPPTASNSSVTIDEDNQQTFSASDFSYSDVENDPFSKIQVTSLPSNGTLYKDDNTNSTVDSGEEISTNDEITKAEIDANKLKFKPRFNENGVPYTTFDFKVNDGSVYSNSAYTMTINVNAVNDAPIAGSGKALDFDGNDDYVETLDNVVLNTGDFSIEFWAKRAQTGGGQSYFIVGQGPAAANSALHIGFKSGDYFTFSFFANDLDATTPYNSTDWHHWAVTYDRGTGERKIYRDATLIESDVAGSTYQGTGPIRLGGVVWNANNDFNGSLDELRIWNSVRTETEIRNNMYKPLAGNESNLAAYFRFDEGTGELMHDATSNKYDGTLTNMDPGSDWVESNAWKNRTTNEDTDLVINPEGYDPDGTALGTSSQVSAPSNGSLSFASVTYSPDSDYYGSDSFTYRVTDGTLTDDFEVNVNVNAVNDPPEITGVFGDNTTEVIAGAGQQNVSSFDDAAVSNTDSPDYNGGFITITQGAGTTNGSWGLDGTTATSGGDGTIAAGETIAVGGTSIGAVHATNDGQGGNNLQIDFNSTDATNTNLQTLIRSFTYSGPSGLGTRTFTLTLNDNDGTSNGGDDDASGSFDIEIIPNPPVLGNIDGDNPLIPVGGTQVNIDAGSNATVTDADSPNFNGGNFRIVQNTGMTNGSFSFSGTGGTGVSSGNNIGVADGTISGAEVVYVDGVAVGTIAADGQSGNNFQINFSNNNPTPARIQDVLRSLKYSAPSGTGDRTFTISLTDAGSNSATGTADIRITIIPPEMDLKQNTTAIADGGSYNFGSQALNSDTDITFTIENTGPGDLLLTTPLTITGADAAQFTIQQQPAASTASANSTTFIIRFTPTTSGGKTAEIAISNNDTDENPYNLTLNGNGNNPPTGSDNTLTANEDGQLTIATGDFGHTDLDSDTLTNVEITTLPAAGTLYLDVNDNNSNDGGGETISAGNTVTKADLDANRLKYIPNGTTNSNFTFKVNDGVVFSNSTYTMTLNINPRPTVTIEQANGQNDPTNSAPINFTVVFDESVTGFSTGDVTLGGTANPSTAEVTGGPTNFNVAVSGMTQNGTVIATIGAGVANDGQGAPNKASTSNDNSVTYDAVPPSDYSVKIDQSYINLSNQDSVSFTLAGAEIGAAYSYTFSSNEGGDDVTGSGSVNDSSKQITNIDLTGLADGTVTLTVTLTDVNGNTGDPAADSIPKDVVPPSLTFSTDEDNPQNNLPFTLNINFSEKIIGFALDDLSVENGSIGELETIETDKEFTVDITPLTTDSIKAAVAANSVTDSAGNSNTAAIFEMNITNTAPLLTSIENDPLSYIENEDPKTVSGTIAIADSNDTNLESAVVQISGNYQQGEDQLGFSDQNGINGNWDSSTGTMNLTGPASVSNYQSALRSITYFNSSDDPNTVSRTVSFTVNDGDDNSNTVSRKINISPQNDAPVLSSIEETVLSYTEGDGPRQITDSIIVSDYDDINIESAVVQITENFVGVEDNLIFTNQNGITKDWDPQTGILTLSGIASIGDYQSALRSVTYFNSNDKFPDTSARTISIIINDGNAESNIATRIVNITRINNIPMLVVNTGLITTEGDSAIISSSELRATDADNVDAKIKYTITSLPQNGDLKFFGNPISLNGTFTQDDINKNRIMYVHDDSETESDEFTFDINDPEGAGPKEQTFGITINLVNDPPVVLPNLSGNSGSYTEGDTTAAISSGLTLSDDDDIELDSASVRITGNYRFGEDRLSLLDPEGLSIIQNDRSGNVKFTYQNISATWIQEIGKLYFSGRSSIVDYQTLLRLVKYENTSLNPDTSTRTISFSVFNEGGSSSIDVFVEIEPVNDPPVISFQGTPFVMNEDEELNFRFSDLYPFVNDPDNPDSTLQFLFESTGENLTVETLADTGFTVTTKENWFGLDTVEVNVSDGELTTAASLAINVLPVNDIPEFVNTPDTLTISSAEGVTLNLFDHVNDVETPDTLMSYDFIPGSDSLLYDFNSATGEVTFTVESQFIGNTDVVIKATDEEGAAAETTINIDVELITGVNDLAGIPKVYELYQNYPNPFNPSTTIRYGLPFRSEVRLVIYNILGEEVSVLKDRTEEAGYYEIQWDSGYLASGVYIYRLAAESTAGDQNFVQVKKMVFIK